MGQKTTKKSIYRISEIHKLEEYIRNKYENINVVITFKKLNTLETTINYVCDGGLDIHYTLWFDKMPLPKLKRALEFNINYRLEMGKWL